MEKITPATYATKERKVKGKADIDIRKCKGCELCITACKEQALTLSVAINAKGYRYAVADNDRCTGCINCALVCPDAVITVYRTRPVKKTTEINTPAATAPSQLLTVPSN